MSEESEERLVALAERARFIAASAYESRMQTRRRVDKSMQRIEASLALLVRISAERL
jgi:hypothetical protein